MRIQQGPINPKAVIAYARQHKHFEEAYNLVTKLYAKQKREFTGVQYISHPSTVASLLLEFSPTPEMMLAALLEETPTRTRLKWETIEKLFGPAVLRMVQDLQEPELAHEGWLAYCEQVATQDYATKTVKLASLLDHACAIPSRKLSDCYARLGRWEQLLPALKGGNSELHDRMSAVLKRALV